MKIKCCDEDEFTSVRRKLLISGKEFKKIFHSKQKRKEFKDLMELYATPNHAFYELDWKLLEEFGKQIKKHDKVICSIKLDESTGIYYLQLRLQLSSSAIIAAQHTVLVAID